MVLKNTIASVILFLLLALHINDIPQNKVKESIVASTTPKVVAIIAPSKPKSAIYDETVRVATKYHLDQESFSKVIFCESHYDPIAWNKQDPYGGSRGVGQFLQRTFDHYKVLAGLPDGDVWNPSDAIEVVGYMWSIHQQSQWSVCRILYGDMQYMTKFREDCDKSYSNFVHNL